jgi:hypothetical protein
MHGQCTDYLKAKLESLAGFPTMKENFNVFELINAVKGVTFRLEDSNYHLEALHDAKIRFYTLLQGKDVDNANYLELFKMHVAVVEQFGGAIARDPVVVLRELEFMGIDKDNASKDEILKARKAGEDKYLGMALVKRAARNRYSRLMGDLVNQFTTGHNNYPQNITVAYNLLINYRVNN